MIMTLLFMLLGCKSTTDIINEQKLNNSIASLEYIQLNGVKQFIMIRSHNINNPILLYIHGGPGTSELSLLRHYNSDLEKYFTIVYWEQRGTGKSYSKKIKKNIFTINQLVEDGCELTKYILHRFNQEKLYLIGHSSGTIISTYLAFEHPELFYAYIGIGQEVNNKKGEELSYKYTLSKAIETNNQKAIKELKAINEPSYLTIKNNKEWYKQLKTERKWLTYFGGEIYTQKSYSQFVKIFLKSSEYKMFDMIKFGKGSIFSLKRLWPEIAKINFLNGYTAFQIPVYFFQGKYDYNCPTELLYEYFEEISAPEKELIIFEESAHNPHFEENNKFNDLIIKKFSKRID